MQLGLDKLKWECTSKITIINMQLGLDKLKWEYPQRKHLVSLQVLQKLVKQIAAIDLIFQVHNVYIQ